jgi:uncharacterized protein (DUF362 family)
MVRRHSTLQISRRHVLKAAAAGIGAGLLPTPVFAQGTVPVQVVSNYPANQWGTPGLYPAQVVAMYHSGSSIQNQYQTGPIQQMIRNGLTALTGAKNYVAAWRQFVRPGDVVGIKINPNGNELVQSSPAAMMEIVSGLLLAGVSPRNIIVYERYAEILSWVAPYFLPSWVQTASAAPAYADDQTDITGYDPNHYVDTQLFYDWQILEPDYQQNPAYTRSHAAQFFTQRVNKIINLAQLKNHNAAGVTLAMKNLTHGGTNNVDRSHPSWGNFYTTYIPAVISMPVIRYKAVLHIVDGIHGQYEAGPHGPDQYVWENKTMYFATDAVAIDRVGWNVIDAQRVAVGMPISEDSTPYIGQPGNLQQPQYILSAGAAGLGECRDAYINLRTTVLG